MLCMPYREVNDSGKKSIMMILLILSGLMIFYALNILLLEMAIKKPSLCLMIIQTLLIFIMLALGMAVYFIKKNHFLIAQLSKQEKVAQEFCIQRDIDMLSGIKNRNAFVRKAQQIEKQGDKVSVMVCDIDGLKIINDTLGHIAGDKIIQKAAEILTMSFPTDADIFRIGGDEYLVIIEGVLKEQQITEVHRKITQMIDQYNATELAVPLSISLGFACSSPGLCAFEEVIKQADYAMYQEKRACQDKVYRHLTAALTEK